MSTKTTQDLLDYLIRSTGWTIAGDPNGWPVAYSADSLCVALAGGDSWNLRRGRPGEGFTDLAEGEGVDALDAAIVAQRHGMTPDQYAKQEFNLIADQMDQAVLDAIVKPDGALVGEFYRQQIEQTMRSDAVVLLELARRFPACPNAAPSASSGCVLPGLKDRCPACLLRSLGIYLSL